MNISFKIILWETSKPHYVLEVDGQKHFECKKGELRKLFNEMEKIARLRYKGELKHD